MNRRQRRRCVEAESAEENSARLGAGRNDLKSASRRSREVDVLKLENRSSEGKAARKVIGREGFLMR